MSSIFSGSQSRKFSNCFHCFLPSGLLNHVIVDLYIHLPPACTRGNSLAICGFQKAGEMNVGGIRSRDCIIFLHFAKTEECWAQGSKCANPTTYIHDRYSNQCILLTVRYFGPPCVFSGLISLLHVAFFCYYYFHFIAKRSKCSAQSTCQPRRIMFKH